MGHASHDPERIERIGQSGLKVRWSDGHESLFDWNFLRARCPCAVCREGGLAPAGSSVEPLELRPVGRYAMNIRWSDGHATGIFSHEYLRSLCRCEECKPGQMTEG